MRNSAYKEIMTLQSTAVAGDAMLVKDYQHLVVLLATGSVGSGDSVTVKFQGSLEDAPPTWDSAKSESNRWENIQVVDLEDGSSIDGATGITISDANAVRMLEINTNGLTWLNAILSAITGTVGVTVKVYGYSNTLN